MDVERRRRSVVGPLIGLLILAALIIVAVVVFTNDDSASARDDVTLQSCQANPSGDKPTASGTIVNHSSKPSNYVIRLKFTDGPGNQVSEGVNAVKDVEPGARASWKLTGTRDAKGPLKCEVTGVSRTHIPGQ